MKVNGLKFSILLVFFVVAFIFALGTIGAQMEGSVMASDAMFPFPDGLQVGIEAGATACIQPGGSVRDEEGIAAANEAGIAMVFTGHRHFRH